METNTTIPLPKQVGEIIGTEGVLARHLPRYEHRPAQLQMALAVSETLEKGGCLLVEAGTGTGKTLAYLIPAILSSRKLLISTGTKTLQEQLYTKDVPFLQRHVEVAVCYMKGRGNYLCWRRWLDFLKQPRFAFTREAQYMKLIRNWLENTRTGDRAELEELPDNCHLWKDICSRSETCRGQKCPHFSDCFITKMKQRALLANIIIVNHHLFFADLAVRIVSPGAIIPNYEGVIFDEAHQLEEVATNYFGFSASNWRIEELVKDTRREAADKPRLLKEFEDLLEMVSFRSQAFFDLISAREARYRLRPQHITPEMGAAWAELENALLLLSARLEGVERQPEELMACARRAKLISAEAKFILRQEKPEYVYWCEQRRTGIFLHASQIEMGSELEEHLYSKVKSLVLTSATLSTDHGFGFIKQRLGIGDARELILPSCFDFTRQAIIHLPRGLPPPKSRYFVRSASKTILEILLRTKGRAFVLFTSFRNLEEAYSILSDKLPFRLLKQGDKPKGVLLRKFKEDIHSVLFATASFWEGVDVPGESLSCVIIDKLPFDVPTEPVVEARIEAISKQGGNPFMEYQLPLAILNLKQGFGRLIRNRKDKGVLVLLDNRVLSKAYGRIILENLPPCPHTPQLNDIEQFFTGN